MQYRDTEQCSSRPNAGVAVSASTSAGPQGGAAVEVGEVLAAAATGMSDRVRAPRVTSASGAGASHALLVTGS